MASRPRCHLNTLILVSGPIMQGAKKGPQNGISAKVPFQHLDFCFWSHHAREKMGPQNDISAKVPFQHLDFGFCPHHERGNKPPKMASQPRCHFNTLIFVSGPITQGKKMGPQNDISAKVPTPLILVSGPIMQGFFWFLVSS